MKKIDVVCGVLIQKEQCLIAKRSTGDSIGKYEFPGGKVEPGETKEEALIREFQEELQIELDQVYYLDHSVDKQNGKENKFFHMRKCTIMPVKHKKAVSETVQFLSSGG